MSALDNKVEKKSFAENGFFDRYGFHRFPLLIMYLCRVIMGASGWVIMNVQKALWKDEVINVRERLKNDERDDTVHPIFCLVGVLLSGNYSTLTQLMGGPGGRQQVWGCYEVAGALPT